MTDNEIVKACKNCLHYEACKGTYSSAKGEEDILYDFDGEMYANSGCEDFIDKDLINRQKAEIEQLQTLVNEMSDYFPACIGCEGKTTLGERTDKCVYEIDNTNYCTKRGITNIVSIRNENRELKAEIERLQKAVEDKGGLILIKEAKAEAYKECVEKVKMEAENATCVYELDRPQADNMVYHISNNRLNNLLKELVGEESE